MPHSKKEALLKTLDTVKNPKEKVSVIHAAYEEKPHVVAFVEVEKEWTDMKKLEHAFMKTNSISDAWWNNEGITKMFDGKTCRSTSVGDMILLASGKKFKCEAAGWSEV